MDTATLGKLDRIADQIEQHHPQLGRIPLYRPGQIVPAGDDIFKLLCVCPKFQHIRHVIDLPGQIKRRTVQRHFLRLDFGNIQYVVDQRQHMQAAAVDRANIFAVSLGQAAIALQQLRIAQNGAKRRTQFVAHVGQESVLGFIGLLRLPG